MSKVKPFKTAKSREDFTKVLYRFHSNTLEEEVVETFWASEIDKGKGIYRLESIPFYAKSLAYGDLIEVKYDEDENSLVLSDILEFSGHSTVQVVTLTELAEGEEIRAVFHSIGCNTERLNSRYFAMDVPAAVPFKSVKEQLVALQETE